jgi:CheY-like chemotaxis protein
MRRFGDDGGIAANILNLTAGARVTESRRVLVIVSDDVRAESFRRYFDDPRLAVVFVRTIAEGIESAHARAPDAIVVDAAGLESLMPLRTDPVTGRAPVIVFDLPRRRTVVVRPGESVTKIERGIVDTVGQTVRRELGLPAVADARALPAAVLVAAGLFTPPGERAPGEPRPLHIALIDAEVAVEPALHRAAVEVFGVGTRVSRHERGLAALRELTLAPPEVVILDLDLPDVDGLTVLKLLKSDPTLRGARAVVVTRTPNWHMLAIALDAGVDAYLFKPLDHQTTVEALERCKRALVKVGR